MRPTSHHLPPLPIWWLSTSRFMVVAVAGVGRAMLLVFPQGMMVRVSLLGGGTLFTPATVLRRYMAALPTSIIKL